MTTWVIKLVINHDFLLLVFLNCNLYDKASKETVNSNQIQLLRDKSLSLFFLSLTYPAPHNILDLVLFWSQTKPMEYRATTDNNNNNNNNKIQVSRDWNIHEGKKKTPSLLLISCFSMTPSWIGWKWLLCRHSVKYTSYPAVKKDHQKAKADENNQSHKQKSTHHGEVILSRKEHI